MWNTCSCHGEKRKSENLETVLYDKLFRLVASTTIKPHVWAYQMSHKVALLTFPSLLVLKKHRNGPGLVYLNWPVWDSKRNIPFGRRGGISLLMCWIAISPSLVERLPSLNSLLEADWTVQAPLTVTWLNYRASCPILSRSDPWWQCNFLEWDIMGYGRWQPRSIFPGICVCLPNNSGDGLNPSGRICHEPLHCKKHPF